MVLLLLSDWEGSTIEKTASGVQSDQFHLYQVQKVPECTQYDFYLADCRLLVSLVLHKTDYECIALMIK
jgi:hypothetical protein